MNIQSEETGTLTTTLKVKITPDDYQYNVDKALKEQRKTAAFPGFRAGQVPMSIVKKRMGRTILVNEVERLIDQKLRSYIQDNQLRVLGQPLPKNDGIFNNWDEPGDLHFQYEMGMAPTVDVELGGKLGVDMPMVNVDDELVGKEIADMQRRFGNLTSVAVVGEQDMVLGDLIELGSDGSIRSGGLMNRTTITMEVLKDGATRQALIGKAVGDEVTVDPDRISDSHEDLAKMLNVDHDRVHELEGVMFLFRIAEIKHMEQVPVDQAMFDKVYGEGVVTDEATFRARVKEGLEGMFRRDSERIFKRLVLRALMEKAAIALPDDFLKRWISVTSKEPITPEAVESGYSDYAKGLRRQLIEDRVVEKYGLEAKGEEMNEFAKRYVIEQFAQYGIPAPEGEKLQEMAGRMLGDRDQIKRMRDSIVDQKLTAHFKAMLEPNEKKVSFDEFVNLARTA